MGDEDGNNPAPATIVPILNRTLPGPCHSSNHGTLAWGPDGLLAYGCHSVVVIVDPRTVQVVQTLSKHKTEVCKLAWSHRVGGKRLVLASADVSGQVISWELTTGEHGKMVSDGNQEIKDMSWVGRGDQHLLTVHPPNHLILWDMHSGSKLWKKSYGDTVLGFDISPLKPDILLLRCQHSFLLTEFTIDKCPKSNGKKFYMINGGNGLDGGGAGQKKSKSKLRKMVRSMMLGDVEDGEQLRDNDCIFAMFHPGIPGQVVLGYSKEVIIVDMELGQAVGQINFDRSNSSLVSICASNQKPVLYLLHESGTVSVWSLKDGLNVAATPITTPLTGMVSSFSLSSMSNYQSTTDTPLLEFSYECLTVSDHIRLGKNCQVSGLAICPSTQTGVATMASDGRLMLMTLKPMETDADLPNTPVETISSINLTNVRLNVTGLLQSLGQLTCIKMCPPLTTKNLATYRPLLALGTVTGHIQLVNVSTGLVEREIAVHSGPVQGLEWTSGHPALSLLSWSHASLTGSSPGLVRNELVHTNILTGKVTQLRTDQGKEPGEAKIIFVKVSHLRRFFVVAFSQGPFELWDLAKMSVLRTMPRKFPHITALEWSPAAGTKSKKSGSVSPGGNDTEFSRSKEHIVMTDGEGQLYHFSVEGHTIKDGTKIPAETGLGTITSILWKSDLIVRGCTEGNINIWNMKSRQNKNIHTGRGSVKRMCFSPGKNNLKLLVLFENGVQIWDLKELEMINELKSGIDSFKVIDIDWASSDRVILCGKEGTVRLAGLALAGTSSHCLAYGRDQEVVCPALLSPHLFSRLCIMMSYSPGHQVTADQFRSSITSGLSEENVRIVDALLDYWGSSLLEFITNTDVSLSDKMIIISIVLGLDFDLEVFALFKDKLNSVPLAKKYDFLADKETFLERQEELYRLHTARAVSRHDRMRLTAGMLCQGNTDAAVSMLMEADLETDTNNMTDQLLACLIQSTANADTSQSESIIKMVATNFVSEGKMWEGVQLLVLIGKVKDACSYLWSGGYHDQSLVVGRCLLEEKEWKELVMKYSEHQISSGNLDTGILSLIAADQHSQALKWLLSSKMVDVALKLMSLLKMTGVQVDKDVEEQVLTESVKMMADLEFKQGFDFYCDQLGEKATTLKSELNLGIAST